MKMNDILPSAEPREYYKTEIFTGAGGNGKTHLNLMDTGLVDVLFISPSWKLSSDKRREFPSLSDNQVIQNPINQPYSDIWINKHSVIVIDEASMITEFDKQFIMRNSMCKLIFCGDVGFQLPPIITELTKIQYIKRLETEIKGYETLLNGTCMTDPIEQPDRRKIVETQIIECQYINDNIDKYICEMYTTGFGNVIELRKNYRYGDDVVLQKVIDDVRHGITKKLKFDTVFNKIKHEFESVSIKQLEEQYTKEDIILCSENAYKDYYTDTFKHIEKYKVLSNTRQYKNGEILFDKVDGIKTELIHGLTAHSIQGTTCENVVYIDTRKQKSVRMLHTCVGRARKANQIKFITDTTEIVNKKYENSVMYKIYNPDCDEFYIGSTINFNDRVKSHKLICREIHHKNHNTKLYKFMRERADGWILRCS